MTEAQKIQIIWLRNRSAAAKACFLDERGHPTRAGEIVLTALKKYCKANSPTVADALSPTTRMIDPLAMALNEGRREVWLFLNQMLQLDESKIAKLEDSSRERDREEYAA